MRAGLRVPRDRVKREGVVTTARQSRSQIVARPSWP